MLIEEAPVHRLNADLLGWIKRRSVGHMGKKTWFRSSQGAFASGSCAPSGMQDISCPSGGARLQVILGLTAQPPLTDTEPMHSKATFLRRLYIWRLQDQDGVVQ